MFPIDFASSASVRESPASESQIQTMRRDVEVQGECIVRYEDLRALCPNVLPPINYWETIAKIAIEEGWSFTFFPDRSVRFARL